MATMVLEGTWEEIKRHETEFNGRRLRVTVLDDETDAPKANLKMREAMKRVKELQKDMRETDGSKTLEILRRGRAGEMFGYEPVDDE